MPTGDVEVLVDNVEVLNEASQNLPFSTADLSVPVSYVEVYVCVHVCAIVHAFIGDAQCHMCIRMYMWVCVHVCDSVCVNFQLFKWETSDLVSTW